MYKTTHHFTAYFILFILSLNNSLAQNSRTTLNFGENWKFQLGNVANGQDTDFDDSNWRTLNVPHDWSIEGAFSESNPASAGGGALPGGVGWYRKSFTLNETDSAKIFYIDFDGVYMNSQVWINGNSLGIRPYGYSSFRYEITQYLKFGGQANEISVKVDNSNQPNSRWYSGSGIYRNVWLVSTDKVHVNHWGTFVTTSNVSAESAVVDVKTTLRNASLQSQTITLITDIYSPQGKKVATTVKAIIIKASTIAGVSQQLTLNTPDLWSIENPHLYKVVSRVKYNNKEGDIYVTPLGIRSFEFNAQNGFLLNGTKVKIKGVCNHHDLGCLGTAINTRALERQLQILKNMGCNGIRTSHNPPAPELLDLADKMGFIILDEAFDMWKLQKNTYDYHLFWDEWHTADLRDFVMRDRNHPSVFMWSIGNEIPEQWNSSVDGKAITKELTSLVKSLDPTRPVTTAYNSPQNGNALYDAGVLDLVGFNYTHGSYQNFPSNFPGKKFLATETTSALATRGHYDMPSSTIRIWSGYPDGNADKTCSAYDNCHVSWGSTHEESWKVIKKYDFLSGMFIWTGFDYLGEPTPYWWPSRSSYFGIINLAGFPKDAYYMYQSEWTPEPMLHIFPHWNWTPGTTIDVWAYSNCQEVELYLNGVSLGKKQKIGDQIHLVWNVTYQPGTLKAIARNNGKEVLTQEIETAGPPAKIILKADRTSIDADGKDLSFVTVQIVDSVGTLVPDAANSVSFGITGDGTLAAVDNGSEVSAESFRANFRKAFNGLCLAVLQAGKLGGSINLTAISPGLAKATITIQTNPVALTNDSSAYATTEIVREFNPKSVRLYPNPSQNTVAIDLGNGGFTKIEIINLTGKTVYLQEISSSETMIEINHGLISGMYLLKLSNGNKVFSTKLLVQ